MSLWTLDGALPLIRSLQPKTRDFGYHLCLGGGVLNKGESNKDLDLVFCPLDNGKPSDPTGLLSYLEILWGRAYSFYEPNPNGAPDQEDFSDDSYSDMPDNNLIYRNKVKFFYDGTDRIDVFIMAPVIDAAMQPLLPTPWTVEQAEAEANAIHDELVGRMTLTSEEDARIRGISNPHSDGTNWVRRFFANQDTAPANNSRIDGITITPADLNQPAPSQYVGTWEGITRSTVPHFRVPVQPAPASNYVAEDAPARPTFRVVDYYTLPQNRLDEISQRHQQEQAITRGPSFAQIERERLQMEEQNANADLQRTIREIHRQEEARLAQQLMDQNHPNREQGD